jgi:hypothetical protein
VRFFVHGDRVCSFSDVALEWIALSGLIYRRACALSWKKEPRNLADERFENEECCVLVCWCVGVVVLQM